MGQFSWLNANIPDKIQYSIIHHHDYRRTMLGLLYFIIKLVGGMEITIISISGVTLGPGARGCKWIGCPPPEQGCWSHLMAERGTEDRFSRSTLMGGGRIEMIVYNCPPAIEVICAPSEGKVKSKRWSKSASSKFGGVFLCPICHSNSLLILKLLLCLENSIGTGEEFNKQII